MAAQEAFEWVCSVPKIVQALCIILRLSDDLKSYEVIFILVLHPISAHCFRLQKWVYSLLYHIVKLHFFGTDYC